MTPEIAFGIAGFAAGGLGLWSRVKDLEERCQVIEMAERDLMVGFSAADDVLGDDRTPEPVREMILMLLAAHAFPTAGRHFAEGVVNSPPPTEEQVTNNRIRIALRDLANVEPELERKSHIALMVMTICLIAVHYADELEFRRAQEEAARDPSTVWSRLASLFGRDRAGLGNGAAVAIH